MQWKLIDFKALTFLKYDDTGNIANSCSRTFIRGLSSSDKVSNTLIPRILILSMELYDNRSNLGHQ